MSVVLLSLASALTVIAAVIAATGGFTIDVAGLSLSMHTVTRPIVGALAMGLLGVLAPRTQARSAGDRVDALAIRGASVVALAFAIVMTAATFKGGAHI